MSPQIEIQIIAVLTAAACALPGVFLMLRRMSLMSDALSHAILPGIVIAFLFTHSLSSPILVLGAALAGVVTVLLVESLVKTALVKEDTAIGLVFPALFAIGVILVSMHAGNVHIDTDAVLLGELAFAPFDRLVVGETDLGPRGVWLMSAILVVNFAFIATFFKELKITTFDAGLAAAAGFAPAVMHYALMSLVSITAVGAFDAVGSILVVALFIAPPASAFLLSDRLPAMLGISAGLGAISALLGYQAARAFDTSIAGSMAVASGVIFGLAVLFAPERGILSSLARHSKQKIEFAVAMLLFHISNHENSDRAEAELNVSGLHGHFRWNPLFTDSILRIAFNRNLAIERNGLVYTTDLGRKLLEDTVSMN